jgi:methylmalonyl-CoA mutase N-terminal domain/subunit
VGKALDGLAEAAAGNGYLMPHLLEAAAARATLGEMVARLRQVFGEFREPLVF